MFVRVLVRGKQFRCHWKHLNRILKHSYVFFPVYLFQDCDKTIMISADYYCNIHPQSGSSSTWFLVELEFVNDWFFNERGKTGVPGEKPLEPKERTENTTTATIISLFQICISAVHIVSRQGKCCI